MPLKEAARRLWRTMDAVASALDYDPREELAARVARLERRVADLGKGPGTSA